MAEEGFLRSNYFQKPTMNLWFKWIKKGKSSFLRSECALWIGIRMVCFPLRDKDLLFCECEAVKRLELNVSLTVTLAHLRLWSWSWVGAVINLPQIKGVGGDMQQTRSLLSLELLCNHAMHTVEINSLSPISGTISRRTAAGHVTRRRRIVKHYQGCQIVSSIDCFQDFHWLHMQSVFSLGVAVFQLSLPLTGVLFSSFNANSNCNLLVTQMIKLQDAMIILPLNNNLTTAYTCCNYCSI